jgi:hypothetical protein
MRDRYSLLVGLAFVAIIVIASISMLGDDGSETLGLDRVEARWPLPEFAVPAAAGELEGDANVSQDDCELAAVPCPEDARRDPRLRPLRPPAGDLVLVHQRRQLHRPAGRRRCRLRALP